MLFLEEDCIEELIKELQFLSGLYYGTEEYRDIVKERLSFGGWIKEGESNHEIATTLIKEFGVRQEVAKTWLK